MVYKYPNEVAKAMTAPVKKVSALGDKTPVPEVGGSVAASATVGAEVVSVGPAGAAVGGEVALSPVIIGVGASVVVSSQSKEHPSTREITSGGTSVLFKMMHLKTSTEKSKHGGHLLMMGQRGVEISEHCVTFAGAGMDSISSGEGIRSRHKLVRAQGIRDSSTTGRQSGGMKSSNPSGINPPCPFSGVGRTAKRLTKASVTLLLVVVGKKRGIIIVNHSSSLYFLASVFLPS
mmetsp:Transcript_5407/g.8535  ORF Transcript_5407/g.8535 Transcript_5407/m.8535 type:complete len:233 (-) Transcript_5407:69-767(-)